MKQPTVTIDGKRYKVTSIWWNDKTGEIGHIYIGELDKTLFRWQFEGDDEHFLDLNKLLQEG